MIAYFENIALKIAHRIAEVLAKTEIRPEQITILRFIIAAPASVYFFSRGKYLYNVVGLAIYMLLAILDWVDGHLARISGRTSDWGKWLDETSDRVLMLLVLASIFYAGMVSDDGRTWIGLSVVFFPVLFFLTALLNEFDRMFNMGLGRYPEIERRVYQLDLFPTSADKFLFNLVNPHRNSITKFCFIISYPLFLGILTDRLALTFAFITFMFALRTVGLIFVVCRVIRRRDTDSALTKVLMEYMRQT